MNVVNIGEININKFSKWIVQNGGEVLPLTSEYEVIRFRGLHVGVLYNTGKYSGQFAFKTLQEFKESRAWTGRPSKTGRKSAKSFKEKRVRDILIRDGDNCFLCNKKLPNSDTTIEHLTPLTSGGSNKLSNTVLVHSKCNEILGHSTLVEKIKLIIEFNSWT